MVTRPRTTHMVPSQVLVAMGSRIQTNANHVNDAGDDSQETEEQHFQLSSIPAELNGREHSCAAEEEKEEYGRKILRLESSSFRSPPSTPTHSQVRPHAQQVRCTLPGSRVTSFGCRQRGQQTMFIAPPRRPRPGARLQTRAPGLEGDVGGCNVGLGRRTHGCCHPGAETQLASSLQGREVIVS